MTRTHELPAGETVSELISRLSPRTNRGYRQGALPRFTQAEAEIIRADPRPAVCIVREYGVCYDTVARVRQTGRFAGIPYVTRDEVQSGTMELMNRQPVPKGLKPGRKPQWPHISIADRHEIAYDLRPAKVVAAKHRISVARVYAIRKEMGIDQIKRRIYRATMQAIASSTSDTDKIARAYRLAPETVERIRNAYLAR